MGLVAPGIATPLRYHCTCHGPVSETRKVARAPSSTGVSTGCFLISKAASGEHEGGSTSVALNNSTSPICMLLAAFALTIVGKVSR